MIRLFALLLLLGAGFANAAIDTYEFKDEATRERFRQLTFELRCPKCQNQNLQDSNSPIAADLRNEVYNMLEAGSDDAEIIDFMVARYGEFVLYKPRVNKMTYVLWYGPFGLALIGVVVIFVIARKRKKPGDQGGQDDAHLSAAEAQRLQDILNEGKDK